MQLTTQPRLSSVACVLVDKYIHHNRVFSRLRFGYIYLIIFQENKMTDTATTISWTNDDGYIAMLTLKMVTSLLHSLVVSLLINHIILVVIILQYLTIVVVTSYSHGFTHKVKVVPNRCNRVIINKVAVLLVIPGIKISNIHQMLLVLLQVVRNIIVSTILLVASICLYPLTSPHHNQYDANDPSGYPYQHQQHQQPLYQDHLPEHQAGGHQVASERLTVYSSSMKKVLVSVANRDTTKQARYEYECRS